MPLRLTIAEKPKVAAEIARVLGAHNRADGYFHGERDIVTWVVGHLIELAEPEDYDASLRVWKRESLPILPSTFKTRVLPKTKAQFKVIASLLAREDVTEVVNACDAAREGELIFDLVCREAGNKKSVKRLWMQANTDEDIIAGYASLRPASAFAGLLAAAHARQRGDWLVGINGTRALTLAAQNGKTYSLGRVITPVVALVVARDEAIENFKPVPYYEVVARFSTADNSTYSGSYFIPPVAHAESQEKRVHRFEDKPEADSVALLLTTSATVVSMSEREVEIKQPLLYDLTQLQIEANIRYGLSAEDTLAAAQALWDAKLITYPRSASQHLPSTINAGIDKHLATLAAITHGSFAHLARAAQHVLDEKLVLTKRHVDDKKLTEGHHAIIPSGESPDFAQLPAVACKIYDLIARRFLAAFYPNARDARTEIVTACFEHHFLTRGVRETFHGWRSIDPPSRVSEEKGEAEAEEIDENASLPKLSRGESVRRQASTTLSKKTRAPQRYTEASLLLAMESAGQLCETEEERLAMKACGLGTVATRASTIAKAFKLRYFEREGKRIVRSSAVAREVIGRLRAVNSLLISPTLTGQWEAELARIAEGRTDDHNFNEGVRQLTATNVKQILASAPDKSSERKTTAFDDAASVGQCPLCKAEGRSGQLRKRTGTNGKFFSCTLAREECGYVSDFTGKTGELKALLELRCSVCQSVMRLKHAKERRTAYLSCTRAGCKGVRFFEAARRTGVTGKNPHSGGKRDATA